MKRDARLHGLSSEHHQALVLARRLSRPDLPWTKEDGEALHRRFLEELEPHFRVEEEVLVPALQTAGASALAERTLADHGAIRDGIEKARAGDADAVRDVGARLTEHVRFEERELFPACEAQLPSAALDEVMRRTNR